MLNGTAEVAFQLYNGNPQITSLAGVTPTDGTAPEPTTVAASAWHTPIATVLSQYFKVTGATITQDGNKYYVQLGDENVQLYGQGEANPVSVDDLSMTYTIVGFPTLYVKNNITTPELQIFVQPEVEQAVKTGDANGDGKINKFDLEYVDKKNRGIEPEKSGVQFNLSVDKNDKRPRCPACKLLINTNKKQSADS